MSRYKNWYKYYSSNFSGNNHLDANIWNVDRVPPILGAGILLSGDDGSLHGSGVGSSHRQYSGKTSGYGRH